MRNMWNKIKRLLNRNNSNIVTVQKDTQEYQDIMRKLDESPTMHKILEDLKQQVLIQNQKFDMITAALRDVRAETIELRQSHQDLIHLIYHGPDGAYYDEAEEGIDMSIPNFHASKNDDDDPGSSNGSNLN